MLLRVGAESMGLFGRSICSSPLRRSMRLLVFRFYRLGFHLIALGVMGIALDFFFLLFSVGFNHLAGVRVFRTERILLGVFLSFSFFLFL